MSWRYNTAADVTDHSTCGWRADVVWLKIPPWVQITAHICVTYSIWPAGICSMFVYRQRLMNPVSVRDFDDDGDIAADCFKTPELFFFSMQIHSDSRCHCADGAT